MKLLQWFPTNKTSNFANLDLSAYIFFVPLNQKNLNLAVLIRVKLKHTQDMKQEAISTMKLIGRPWLLLGSAEAGQYPCPRDNEHLRHNLFCELWSFGSFGCITKYKNFMLAYYFFKRSLDKLMVVIQMVNLDTFFVHHVWSNYMVSFT